MDYRYRISSYIKYWLDQVNQHSLHSPFLYNFYLDVITNFSGPSSDYENLRNDFIKNNTLLDYQDPGAGKGKIRRTISEIAKRSLSDRKYSLLYQRIIDHVNAGVGVELGTSLGINTLYLADKVSQLYTFEGAQPVAQIARDNFTKLKKENIELIEGNIDHTFKKFLETQKKLDFVFFDANHTYDATLSYFNLSIGKATHESVFIFDDIHWSAEMGKAWEEIKNHEAVFCTLDLYRCGIVLFNPYITRQHWALKF